MNTDRFDVTAADGAPIAVWVKGRGPALVMVHGSIADHTTFDSFVAVLGEHFTTYAMDRRGFGATPDVDRYTIEVDFADVAAVVDAVAARTGGPIVLWGHSYGANCAMGGAARTANVSHLVVYEPSLGLPYPPGSIERIEAALADGDHDAAIVAVLVDILEMTADEIDTLRADPLWPVRLGGGPHRPTRVPGRAGLGVPARTVRHHHRADTAAHRIGQRRRHRRRHPASRGRDPQRTYPSPRRARPLRPQDRPGDGHRRRPRLRRLMSAARPAPPASAPDRRGAGDDTCRHRLRLAEAAHAKRPMSATPPCDAFSVSPGGSGVAARRRARSTEGGIPVLAGPDRQRGPHQPLQRRPGCLRKLLLARLMTSSMTSSDQHLSYER